MQRLAEMFKALGEETRLKILVLLELRGELCVCDVEGALEITQSKASRHLRYLRNAGLLADRRDGAWMHYRVAEDLPPELRRVIRELPEMIPPSEAAALYACLETWMSCKCSRGDA